MHWLSHGVEQLITNTEEGYAPEVLVVGSGYGGSVAALRSTALQSVTPPKARRAWVSWIAAITW